MKLKRNVVMLPTNEKSNMFILDISKKMVFDPDYTTHKSLPNGSYQHLYITSNEKPIDGDWCYKNDVKGKIFKWIPTDNDWYKDSKKIVATTDKSLLLPNINFKNWDGKTRNLPSPSDGFIKKFIERYNAGNTITEVMVEYEDDYSIPCIIPATDCEKFQLNIGDCKGCIHSALKLKVDSNNCITITAVKDSWTRKEVMQLCFQAFIQHKVVDGKITPSAAEELHEPFNKWIEENL
jgi:hypothetical protein